MYKYTSFLPEFSWFTSFLPYPPGFSKFEVYIPVGHLEKRYWASFGNLIVFSNAVKPLKNQDFECRDEQSCVKVHSNAYWK